MDIATVIVAAGSGSRFGGSLPKQFLMLEGKPVLCHSIDTFRGTFPEAPIVLVLSDEGRLWWDEFCRATGYKSPVVAPGGATRADSVLSGIAALEKTTDNNDTIVMIHDGARPLATHRLLLSLAEAASAPGADGAVPAAPMADSMVSIAADGTISCPQRSGFRRVQTPQVFKLARLLHAHRAVEIGRAHV